MTTRKLLLSTAVLLLLIATGLRAWQLDAQSLWFDEGFSWHAAQQPTLSAVPAGDATNPPVYYLLLHIWIRLVGDSEFGLRAFSLLQGILLLAGIGALARRWFEARTALIALGLGTFTPLLWWAAQEARMYNTLALAVLLMTAGYLDLLRRPQRRRAWLALAVGELIALYTHNTGIVILGAINLAFALGWLIRLRHSRPDWRLVWRWAVAQAAVLALWLPELLARFRNLGGANAALRTPPALSPQLLWQSWQAIWASSWEMVLAAPPALQLSAGLLLLLLIGGLAALRHPAGRRLWGLLAALYTILIAALMVLGVNFHGRYLVFLAPLLVIVLAAGLGQLGTGRGRNLAGSAAVCAVALVWVMLPGQPDTAYQHDQAREITRYYVEHLGPDDLILTWSYAERYELLYYAEKMNLPARLITLPEGGPLPEIVDLLNAAIPPGRSIRAEINTWYTQASDRRGMLPCLIGHRNPPPGAAYTVQGMTTRAFTIAQPIALPASRPVAGDFGPLQVAAIPLPDTPFPADRGICLPVEVTLSASVTEDYRAAANLLNPAGQEIAGADAPLLTAAQQPPSHLAPGDSATAFLLLHLPQGTPPGDYPVFIRLYSPDRPAGLDLRDPASGAPLGKDLAVGDLTVTVADWPAFSGDCSLTLAPGTTLTNCAALDEGATFSAGSPLNLTLALQAAPDARQLSLTLESTAPDPQSRWAVSAEITLGASGAVLAWPVLRLPADAAGPARLSAQVDDHSPVELARYTVAHAERLLEPPPVQARSGAEFTEAGALYGFSVADTTLAAGAALEVRLVWQAAGATTIPYAVTAQLLSPEGVLLAQHDGQPGGGERPTTGWIAAEYIEDTHVLEFREEHRAYTGPATLLVALYDPATGARVPTQAGADHARLPVELNITAR